MKKDRKTFSII